MNEIKLLGIYKAIEAKIDRGDFDINNTHGIKRDIDRNSIKRGAIQAIREVLNNLHKNK